MNFLRDLFAIILSIYLIIIIGVWWSYIEEARQFERDQASKVQQ